MTDAIKRAAEELYAYYTVGPRYSSSAIRPEVGDWYDTAARAALTAALSDREGMARVLYEHRARGFSWNDECRCGWPIPSWIDDGPDAEPIERPDRMAHYSHQADAIRAHLLGGEA